MSLTTADVAQIVKKYQRAKNDTGSSEVQIALLSTKINYLTEHMKTHKHDFHSRHGLTKMVSRRRRLLNYLKKVDSAKYRDLIQKLEVRG